MNCEICYENKNSNEAYRIFDCSYCDNFVCIDCHEKIDSNKCPFCRNYNWRRHFNKTINLIIILNWLKEINLNKTTNFENSKMLVLSGFTYFGLNNKFNNLKVKLDEESEMKLLEYLGELEMDDNSYCPYSNDLLTVKVKPFSLFFDKDGNQVETIKPKHNIKFSVTFSDIWTRSEDGKQGISCILQECKMENRVMSSYLN